MYKDSILLLLFSLLVTYSFGQIIKTKIIDNGGSGLYKAVAVTEKSLPDFVLYRPLDIQQATEKEGKLPVLVWAFFSYLFLCCSPI